MKKWVGLARCSAALRLPTLGYTVDSFAPAQLALRANLRLLHLAPAPALDCLSLGICAIARVFLRRAFGAARSSPDMWGLS